LQKHGGAGGQHGVESIIDSLGGVKEFDRIKVGVGPDPGGDVRARFVLSRVPEKDRELFAKSLEMTSQAVREWLEFGPDVTANHFNGRNLAEPPKPPKPPKPTTPAKQEASSVTTECDSGAATASDSALKKTADVVNEDGSQVSA